MIPAEVLMVSSCLKKNKSQVILCLSLVLQLLKGCGKQILCPLLNSWLGVPDELCIPGASGEFSDAP